MLVYHMCFHHNQAAKEYMSRVLYASAMGGLMYAMVCTRGLIFPMQLVLSASSWVSLERNVNKLLRGIFCYLKVSFMEMIQSAL